MNRAQQIILNILQNIPEYNTHERDFLKKSLYAWEGYDDSSYSYPHHQLRALEEEYSLTIHQLGTKYEQKITP